jgi:hypothetical protein
MSIMTDDMERTVFDLGGLDEAIELKAGRTKGDIVDGTTGCYPPNNMQKLHSAESFIRQSELHT